MSERSDTLKDAAWAAGGCIQDLCFSGRLKDMCAADLACAVQDAIRNAKPRSTLTRELCVGYEGDIAADHFTPRGPQKGWTGAEADALVQGWNRAQDRGRGLRESLFAAVNEWLRHHAQAGVTEGGDNAVGSVSEANSTRSAEPMRSGEVS